MSYKFGDKSNLTDNRASLSYPFNVSYDIMTGLFQMWANYLRYGIVKPNTPVVNRGFRRIRSEDDFIKYHLPWIM